MTIFLQTGGLPLTAASMIVSESVHEQAPNSESDRSSMPVWSQAVDRRSEGSCKVPALIIPKDAGDILLQRVQQSMVPCCTFLELGRQLASLV